MPAPGLPFPEGVTILCDQKLYRCCGEGPLRCEQQRGHDGPHQDEGVLWG